MRKNLNRALAILLSVALLVSCSISGLVLPALASQKVNLLAGKVENSYTVASGSNKAIENISVDLKSGTRYALRAYTQGPAGKVSAFLGSGKWAQITTAESQNARAYQLLFVPSADIPTIDLYLYNDGTSGDLTVTNLELWEAPADGTFNLIPGSSFGVESSVFAKSFDAGVSLADPDGDGNTAMFWPTGSSSLEKTWGPGCIREANSTHTLYKLTFRMKGSLRIYEGMGAGGTFLVNNDCTSVSGTNYYYSYTDWKTVTIIMDTGNVGQTGYLYFRREGSGNTLYIDDMCLTELVRPTALTMSKSKVGIYPGNGTQLSVTAAPDNAYFEAEDIVWTSTDPSSVTVDNQGNVKVLTTAEFGKQVTITAAYSDTVKATCTVTVDENAPKPPAYSVVGQNGFAGVNAAASLNGGDAAVEIPANVLLKANTRYAVRYTAKSSVVGATVTHNGGSDLDAVPVSTEWNTTQFLFKTDANAAGILFKVTVTPSTEAGSTLEIKDFEIWEAPEDGSFNLIPGSTFDTQTDALAGNYTAGAYNTTDPDNSDNNVLCLPAGDDCKSGWSIKNVMTGSMLTSRMLKIVFKYKGHVQFNDWSDGRIISWGEDANVLYSGNNVRNLQYYSTEWTETTIYYDYVNFGNIHYMDLQHAIWYQGGNNHDAYIDDFCIYEVPVSTGLQMSQGTLNLYPQDGKQLTVSGLPANSYLETSRVTWKSSNDAVATVDAYGNVKAVGTNGQTATITAMLDGVDAATCVVTVDETAPKPPQETETGVNAMETTADAELGASSSKAVESRAILKANTRYVLRVKTKSPAATATLTTNAGTNPYTIPKTDGWYANQIMFTPATSVYNFTVTLATSDSQLSATDWELYEAVTDGTFNVIPGSDFEAQSAFFADVVNKGASYVDDADRGQVLYLPKSADGSMFGYLNTAGVWGNHAMASGLLKITFAYKGRLRLELGHQDASFEKSLTDGTFSANERMVAFASETWTTATVYIKTTGTEALKWTAFRNSNLHGAADLYVDNFQIYEIPNATSVVLDRDTLNLYPSDSATLTVAPVPSISYLNPAAITWGSSDESVAIVDANGTVTVRGTNGQTATITVYYNGNAADTCLVTADESAPKPPTETQPNVNGLLGFNDFDLGADAVQTIDSRKILKAGTRYVLRFVTKNTAANVTVKTNVPNVNAFTVPVTAQWRANQIMFTTAAKVDNLVITVTTPAGDAVTLNAKDWELYEAPTDGTFNILPGSTSDAESAFLGKHFDQELAEDQQEAEKPQSDAARIEKEKDSDNYAIHMPSNVREIEQEDGTKEKQSFGANQQLDISAIGGFAGGKVWALTFRLKGVVRFENWGVDVVYVSQPDAMSVTGNGKYTYFASEDWKTVTYYIKPDADQARYIQFANRNENGAFVDTWIDDISLKELTPSDSLAIVEQDLRLYPTSTQQLTYTWGPTDSVLIGRDILWKTSDPNVVMVDEKTGRITLIGDVGESATITAYNDYFTDGTVATTVITIDDTVPHADPVESIALYAPCGQDMDIGQTYRFMLRGTPADNLVGRTVWTSSNEKLATVDKYGNVTAIGAGEVTITAKTEFNKTVSAKITIHAQANLLVNGDFEQSAAISWRESKLVKDGLGQYGSNAFVFNGAGSQYYSGDVPVKPATTYIISYRYKAEKGADFRLYTGSLGAGNLKPSVFVEPGTIATAEWQYAYKTFTTSDYIDPEKGYVFSLTTSETDNVGKGVYAYVDNVAIREYIVGAPVSTLQIEQQDITLAPGRATKLTLKATPTPADLNAIEWTSSDEQVAYVVAGNVTAVGAGEAIITATAKSKVQATCKVTVNGMKAPLQNGTFETVDNPKTPEIEGTWILSGNAKYAEGEGVARSTALRFDPQSGKDESFVPGGSISQKFKGLKAETAYQVMFRYRLRNKDTVFSMTITNSKGQVVGEGTITGANNKRVSYDKDCFKLGFITPAGLSETEELTITFKYETGEEYVMLDQVALIESASEVDLIVSDITWSPDNADQLTPDTKVSFIISVVNQGKEAYEGTKPFTIDIMVDAQKVKTLTYEGKIDVGEMLMVRTPAGDEWAATAGDHMITAHVNSTMTILESDDTNNYATVNLRVAKEEDFVKAPEAALAMGYNRLTFSDHFTTQSTIDKTASGNHGYKWYVTRPWGESTLTADDYRVEDGVLYLTTRQTAWNYSMCTVDAKKAGVGFSYNMGYMEIRLRMKATADNDGYAICKNSDCGKQHLAYDLIRDAGGNPDNWTTAQIQEFFASHNIACPSCGKTKFTITKVNKIRVPAVWSFSDDTIWGTRPASKDSLELDWIEYWGDKYGTLRFDTTLHHSLKDENGKDLGKVTTGQRHDEPIGDYQWHTYAMAWSEGVIKTYFDNELIGTQRYSKDDYPDPMPTGSINVEAGGADPREGLFSILDEQNMPIILGGASDFPLEVDWVHVWQSDGSLDPTEEEDEKVAEFLKEFLTEKGQDGKETLTTKVTIDNYEKILQGEKAYVALSPEQQTAIDEKLGVKYLDLVAEIYSAQGKAENFIPYYACAEDGTPYTTVDAGNYAWILGAQAEWDALTDFERALIDKLVLAQSGMSFTQMLEAAAAFEDTAEPNEPGEDDPTVGEHPETDLTWLWIVLGVLGGIIVIGGVVIVILLFVKKKKK